VSTRTVYIAALHVQPESRQREGAKTRAVGSVGCLDDSYSYGVRENSIEHF
jgi:hypothetical protein